MSNSFNLVKEEQKAFSKVMKELKNSTYANLCWWCKKQRATKLLKVSPKRVKPACCICYEMMTIKPEIKKPKLHPIFEIP
jgi:hypothetical protein